MVVASQHFVLFGLSIAFFLLGSSGASTISPQDGSSICKRIASKLSSRVFFPTSSECKASVASYWAVQARVSPDCVVIPTQPSEVATAVKILSQAYQTDSQVPRFAVRSGGHTTFPGAGNTAGGVTLDLSNLSSVNINKRQKVVPIGSGLRWGAVYEAVTKEGLAVLGGRDSGVGVGGLITGGKSNDSHV